MKQLDAVWLAFSKLPELNFHDDRRVDFVSALFRLERAIKLKNTVPRPKSIIAVARGRKGGLERARRKKEKEAQEKRAWDEQLARAIAFRRAGV